MDRPKKDISRRRFFGSLIKYSALLGLSPALISSLSRFGFAQNKYPDLVIVEGDDPEIMLRKAIDELGGIKRFIVKGDCVVIKPNMAFATPPDWGNNTNPLLAVATIKICQEAKPGSLTMIDFPQGDPQKCLERNGVGSSCGKIPGVTVKMLKKEDFKKVPVPKGKVLKEVEVAKDILKADVFINIPVAKAHSATKVSLGLKNLMGVIYDRAYFHQMVEINQAIADLATVVKPKLTILDATRCMTTNGPAGPGQVVKVNTIVVGTDPVAVDAFGVTLAQWDNTKLSAQDVGYIKLAGEMKLGETDIKKMILKRVKV